MEEICGAPGVIHLSWAGSVNEALFINNQAYVRVASSGSGGKAWRKAEIAM